MRPGCGRSATSGGLPPLSLVPRIVAVLLPVEVNETDACVCCSNALMTFSKFACSAPDHSAATSMCWPARLCAVAFGLGDAFGVALLHAAPTRSSATAIANTRTFSMFTPFGFGSLLQTRDRRDRDV